MEASGRKGMYWKVKVGKEQGFVSVLTMKRMASKKNLSDVIRKAARDSREKGENASIRSRSAVMGVRGLDASDQVAAAGNVKPDLRAVYRMEDRAYWDDQVLQAYEDRVNREIEKYEERAELEGEA